jgi:hypothetical protein
MVRVDAGIPGTVSSVVLHTEPRTLLPRSLTAGEVYTGSSHQGFIDGFGRSPAWRGHVEPITGAPGHWIEQSPDTETDNHLKLGEFVSCRSANPDY